MESLGEFLRRERQLRGVTLEAIAAATKVNLRYLTALEADTWQGLPADPFIRGYLRAYANFLGLDPQEVILIYQGERNRQLADGPVDDAGEPRPREGASKGLMIGLFLGFVAAAGGGLLYLGYRLQGRPVVLAPAAVGSLTGPQGGGERPGAEGVTASGPLELKVSALADTWLRIKADRGEEDTLLIKGSSRTWRTTDRFILTIGNVRGTEIRLNGKIFPLPATNSNVLRDLVLTRDSIK